MKRVPVFPKRLSDFLPWARSLLRKTAVTGMGALALGPAPQAAGVPTTATPAAVAILNREKRSSAGKLILQIGNRFDVLRAAHRSHSSHSSHRSHSSHVSHYSSSSTPAYTPPRAPVYIEPSPSPESSSPRRSTQPLVESTLMSEAGAERTVVTVRSIDFKPSFTGSSILGRTKTGTELRFYFRSDTEIRIIGAEEVTRPIGQFLTEKSTLPFKIGEEVQVLWKVHPATYQNTAIRITVIE